MVVSCMLLLLWGSLSGRHVAAVVIAVWVQTATAVTMWLCGSGRASPYGVLIAMRLQRCYILLPRHCCLKGLLWQAAAVVAVSMLDEPCGCDCAMRCEHCSAHASIAVLQLAPVSSCSVVRPCKIVWSPAAA